MADYTVKEGDSLERIAGSIYGSQRMWQELANANPGISNANLRSGMKLRLPPKVANPVVRPPAVPSPQGGTMGGVVGAENAFIKAPPAGTTFNPQDYGQAAQPTKPVGPAQMGAGVVKEEQLFEQQWRAANPPTPGQTNFQKLIASGGAEGGPTSTALPDTYENQLKAEYDQLLIPDSPALNHADALMGDVSARQTIIDSVSLEAAKWFMGSNNSWAYMQRQVDTIPYFQQRIFAGAMYGRRGGGAATELTQRPFAPQAAPDLIKWWVKNWNDSRATLYAVIGTAIPSLAPTLGTIDALARDYPELQYMAALPPSIIAIKYWFPQVWQHVSKLPEQAIMLYDMTTPAALGGLQRFWHEVGPWSTAGRRGGVSATFAAGAQRIIWDETPQAFRERLARQNAARMDFWGYVYEPDEQGNIYTVPQTVYGGGGKGGAQPTGIEYIPKINWGRVFGTFQVAPDSTNENTILVPNTGITGLGVTFWLHPERLSGFTADMKGGMSFMEASQRYEDIGAELFFNLATDAILLPMLPGIPSVVGVLSEVLGGVILPGVQGAVTLERLVNFALFPPGEAIGPALTRLADLIGPMRLQAGSALATDLTKVIDEQGWFAEHFGRFSRKSLLRFCSDATNDALNTLVIKYSKAADGDAIKYWQDILSGNRLFLERKGIGEAQISQVLDMVKFFEDSEFPVTEFLDISSEGAVIIGERAFKSRAYKTMMQEVLPALGKDFDATTAEGKAAIEKLMQQSLRSDPGLFTAVVGDMYTSMVRKALGIKTPIPGTLTWFMTNAGQAMREFFLAGSVRFNLANAGSNMMNALAEGYAINPLGIGAAERAINLYESFSQMGFPNEVVRSIWVDMLEGMERGHLLIQEIPIPGWGTPEYFAKHLPDVAGPLKSLLQRAGEDDAPAMLKALNRMNLSKLLQKSMEMSSGIESTARSQMFIKAFFDDFQGRFMTELIDEVANDAAAPQGIVNYLRTGRIHNTGDVEEIRNVMFPGGTHNATPLSILAPQDIDSTNEHIYRLYKKIDRLQTEFTASGDLNNPEFMKNVNAAFDEARYELTRRYEQFVAGLDGKKPDLAQFVQDCDRALGIAPDAPSMVAPFDTRTGYYMSHPNAAWPPEEHLVSAEVVGGDSVGDIIARGASEATAPASGAPPALNRQGVPISTRIQVRTAVGGGDQIAEEDLVTALSTWNPQGVGGFKNFNPTGDPAVDVQYLIDQHTASGDTGDFPHWVKNEYTARFHKAPPVGNFRGTPDEQYAALEAASQEIVADMVSTGKFEQPVQELRGTWDAESRQWVFGRVAHPRPEGTSASIVNFTQDGANSIELYAVADSGQVEQAVQDLAQYGLTPETPLRISRTLVPGGERAGFAVGARLGEIPTTAELARGVAARGEAPTQAGAVVSAGGFKIGAGRAPSEMIPQWDQSLDPTPAWMLSGKWDNGGTDGLNKLSYSVRGVLVKGGDGQLHWYFNVNGVPHDRIYGRVVADGLSESGIQAYFTNDGTRILVELRGGAEQQAYGALIREGFDPRVAFQSLKVGRGGAGTTGAPQTLLEHLGEFVDTPIFKDSLLPLEPAAREAAFAAEAARPIGPDAGKLKIWGIQSVKGGEKAGLSWGDRMRSGETLKGVVDIDTGDIGWASTADARFGESGSHSQILDARFGPEVNDPRKYINITGTPDGKIMASVDSFTDARKLAKTLSTQQGFDGRNIVVFQLRPSQWDPTGGQFVGYLKELLTGELDPGAPTEAELFMWEIAKQGQFENLRTEAQNQFNKVMVDMKAWQSRAQQRFDEGIVSYAAGSEEQMRTAQWFDGLKKKIAGGLEGSTYIAAQKVHHTFFDYGAKGAWEEILRMYSPFTTWQLRNPMFWAQVFAARPGLMMEVYKVWRAMELQRKRDNLTTRFQNTLTFDTPGGGKVGIDVRLAIPVMQQVQEPFEPIGYEQPQDMFTRSMKWAIDAGQWIGLRPWPWLEYGLGKLGVLPERDVLRGLFGPFQRLAETVMMITGERSPWESAFGTIDPYIKAQYEYYINREIQIMEAQGDITHAQASLALDNPGDPTYVEATKRVIGEQAALQFLSLISPTAIKYAAPGEVITRQELAQKAALPDINQAAYAKAKPELSTYARLFETPEQRARDIKLEQLYGSLNQPNVDQQKRQEIFSRIQELGTSKIPYGSQKYTMMTNLPRTATDEQQAYQWMNALEPQPDTFKDAAGNINWNAYDNAIAHFDRLVPLLTDQWGHPMTLDRYQQWADRAKDPINIAFELNQQRRDEGWRQLGLYEPGGERFYQAAGNYVSGQYQADLLSGMDEATAMHRYIDTWKDVMANGLPYEIESQLVKQYADEMPAEQFAAQVAQRLGFNPADMEAQRAIRAGLQDQGNLPGMFATTNPEKQTRQDVLTYYYNLMPDERRQVKRALGVPDAISVNDWYDALTPNEQRGVMGTISERTRALSPDERGTPQMGVQVVTMGGAVNNGVVDEMLPPNDAMTTQEHTDMIQVQRDWYNYNYDRTVLRRGGTWTPLMERYYGDPESPSGKFWGELSQYALAQAAFDDPVMSAFLNTVSRGGLDFSDVQYNWATEYFKAHVDAFIDPVLTDAMAKHPTWKQSADEARNLLSSKKDLTMEQKKYDYYTLSSQRPSPGVASPREIWERDNPEEYDKINRYLQEEKAYRLKYPEYLYFSYPREYKKWFDGITDPSKEHEAGQRLSDLWLQALSDLDKWEAGNGLWTYALEVFVGPDPNHANLRVHRRGGGGGGGGKQTFPGPQPPPIPPPPAP